MADFMKKITARGKSAVASSITAMKESSTIYSGDPSLHWGTGGWAKNRINVVYGPTRSGKSAICALAAAQVQQKDGGMIIIYDSEYFYKDSPEQVERLSKFGANIDDVHIISSNKVDELFHGLKDMEEDIISGKMKVSAIIVDSWGGIQSEQAENKLSDNKTSDAGNSFGGNAKLMNPILGVLERISAENGVTTFVVQHCIKNMEQYGSPYLLLGGERFKYLSHMMLFVEGSQAKDAKLLEGDKTLEKDDKYDGEIMVGKKILFRCEKSRKVVEGRKGEFFMNFEECRFAKPEISLFNLAVNLGVIGHPVNEDGKESIMMWQYPMGPNGLKFKGKANTISTLAEDKILFDKVMKDCLDINTTEGTSETLSSVGKDEDAPVSSKKGKK